MSETNSAVLDLQDDRDELDSVPTSNTADGAEVAAPLIMEEGYDIAVKVDNPIKQLSTLETFVTYRVRCVCARWPSPPYVRRRYNHFKVFHKRLSAAHPLLAIPPLPPHHSALEQLDRYEQNFVALRTLALNAFMDRIVKHPILTHSDELRLFITTSESEADREFKSESALWGLPGFGARESRAAGAQRVKDPEFSGALDYLTSLQNKLSTLNALTSKLHKGTRSVQAEMAGLSTALSSWKSVGAGAAARAAGTAARARHGERHGERHGASHGERARHGAPALNTELPFLAAYAAALADKITQRNQIHAAHVSGNTTEELHNKLLLASESLRSDLADWTPKTRHDIKKTLLNMADQQINIHQQTFQAWEQALKEATAKTPEELFKTVSKTAVQNLSPTKHQKIEDKIEEIDSHTERDIEEFDLDSDIQELSLNEEGLQENCKVKVIERLKSKRDSFEGSTQVEIHNYDQNSASVISGEETKNDGDKSASDVLESSNEVAHSMNDGNPVNDVNISTNDVFESLNDGAQCVDVTNNDNINSNLIKPCDINNVVSNACIKSIMSENDAKTLDTLYENQFLEINSELSEKDVSSISVQSNLDSITKEQSAKLELKGVNATSDPLSDFTDIDLNNT